MSVRRELPGAGVPAPDAAAQADGSLPATPVMPDWGNLVRMPIRKSGPCEAVGHYSVGGLIITCAPAVPGYISQGAFPGVVVIPVDSEVAYGV